MWQHASRERAFQNLYRVSQGPRILCQSCSEVDDFAIDGENLKEANRVCYEESQDFATSKLLDTEQSWGHFAPLNQIFTLDDFKYAGCFAGKIIFGRTRRYISPKLGCHSSYGSA